MPHSQLPCFAWSKTRDSFAVALIASVFAAVPLVRAQQRHLDPNPQGSNSRPSPPSQSRPASGNSKAHRRLWQDSKRGASAIRLVVAFGMASTPSLPE